MRVMPGQTSGATDIEMVEYLRQRGSQATSIAAPEQMPAASMGAAPKENRMAGGPPTPGEMPGGEMRGTSESRMSTGPPQVGQMPGAEVNFGELFRATAQKGIRQPPASTATTGKMPGENQGSGLSPQTGKMPGE
jgi:hypothetical protein